ncbi:hypothetical protein SAMN05444004_12054 [Jannaschia faecimaris]|uniref:Uncharacterized protein n=1 Tax=Jannaschia faecimaris TaxID=1244108 RepID=A0A1H3TXN1_9RHOB|nr:hypothetical protein SAMN05444004_12054 [Jannaschia faecimaris]
MQPLIHHGLIDLRNEALEVNLIQTTFPSNNWEVTTRNIVFFQMKRSVDLDATTMKSRGIDQIPRRNGVKLKIVTHRANFI